MAKKIHLDAIIKPEGTTWFTLIFENNKSFIEERLDSNMPNVKNAIKTILPSDFGKHIVNGIPLNKLVADRLNEVYSMN